MEDIPSAVQAKHPQFPIAWWHSEIQGARMPGSCGVVVVVTGDVLRPTGGSIGLAQPVSNKSSSNVHTYFFIYFTPFTDGLFPFLRALRRTSLRGTAVQILCEQQNQQEEQAKHQ